MRGAGHCLRPRSLFHWEAASPDQHREGSASPGDTVKVPDLVPLSSHLQIILNPPPLYSSNMWIVWELAISAWPNYTPIVCLQGCWKRREWEWRRTPSQLLSLRFKSKSSAMKTVSTRWQTVKRRKHPNVWLNSRILSGGSDQVDMRSFPRSSQRLPALRSDCFSPEFYSSPSPAPAKTDSSQSTRD